MYSKTYDQSKKGKQVKGYSETSNARRSSKVPNPKVVNTRGIGSSGGSERQRDVINTGKSGERNHPDTHVNVTKSSSLSSESSRSSSLSESSSDDLFQKIDALKLIASDASKLIASDAELASNSGRNNASSIDSSDSRPPLPISSYQVYTPTYKQKGDTSPIMSPPMQVMDRSGRYDSSRIPASVFERNGNPLDWSIASNESLFSLHIGQNSFSRDTFKVAEVTMSEELTKSDELNMFNRVPSVTIEEIDIARESVDVEVENLPTTETSDELSRLEQKFSEDKNKIKTLHQHQAESFKSSVHQAENYKSSLHQAKSGKSSSKTSASSVSVSHEGRTAAHTFVPLKKRSKPFCSCCNCSWAICHPRCPNLCHTRSNCGCHTCKWSNCCFGWPSCKCSCCGLVFCCCCNCCHTKSSGHASPILRDSEGNSSSCASCWGCHWFRCFSCPKPSASCWSCHCFSCFTCPSCTFRLSCPSCPRWKCCC